MVELKDKFLGCILGLGVGDAMGYPVEFKTREDILETFGSLGIEGIESYDRAKFTHSHPIGYFSDDTQMTLATAKGLLASPSLERSSDVIDNIIKEYILWSRSPENNRAPGTTCMAGIRNLAAGKRWLSSGIPDGEGCGAAMRTAPIGLIFFHSPEKVRNISYVASICTHGEVSAVAAGMGVANAVAFALNSQKNDDANAQDIFKQTKAFATIYPPSTTLMEKLNQVEKVLKYDNTTRALEELGEGWKGREALAMAMYCFLKNPTNFRKAILMGTNITGDSDSVASITGAISGAFNGVQAIPKEWIARLERKDELVEIAEQLYTRAMRFY